MLIGNIKRNFSVFVFFCPERHLSTVMAGPNRQTDIFTRITHRFLPCNLLYIDVLVGTECCQSLYCKGWEDVFLKYVAYAFILCICTLNFTEKTFLLHVGYYQSIVDPSTIILYLDTFLVTSANTFNSQRCDL